MGRYPIERVYATPHDGGYRSPKADMLAELRPIAFVDDYLPYLRGVAPDVHTALITRGATGGPNGGPELALAKSTHLDLAEFADTRSSNCSGATSTVTPAARAWASVSPRSLTS